MIAWRRSDLINAELPHRPHTPAHPRSLVPALPSPRPFPHITALLPATLSLAPHTVHTRPHIHARSCPFSLHPPGPHMSAHLRSLMPSGPSPHPYPIFPLYPRRPHTSAHPRSLMPTRPSLHPFPTFPLHPHRPHMSTHPCHFLLRHHPHTSAHPRSLMPAHPSFSQPISTLSLAPTPSARAVRSCHRSFSPPISNLSLAPAPFAHVRASTLAHARRSVSRPNSNLSLALTLSAHVRSTQRAPRAVSRLNENRSMEDAFGKIRIYLLLPFSPYRFSFLIVLQAFGIPS